MFVANVRIRFAGMWVLLLPENSSLEVLFSFRNVIFLYAKQNVQCREEAHRPVVCETVAKWILKNSAESENMNWYTINNVLKYCPVCVSYITHIPTNSVCYKLSRMFSWVLCYFIYVVPFISQVIFCFSVTFFIFWWSLMFLISWYLFLFSPMFSCMYSCFNFSPSILQSQLDWIWNMLCIVLLLMLKYCWVILLAF